MSKQTSRSGQPQNSASLRDIHAVVEEILRRWQQSNPHPKCELYFESPFQLLVSVVLSAQTTDKMVNRCMTSAYQEGLTPDTLIAWKEEGIRARIKSIGLANTKAKNVFSLAKIIRDCYSGQIPATREELEALPGVGRKTANVVLGEIFRQPTLAVDTHVLRVSQRLGLHPEVNPMHAEKALLRLIHGKHLPQAHHWFIHHGRYVCTAKNPQCERCILSDLCPRIGVPGAKSKPRQRKGETLGDKKKLARAGKSTMTEKNTVDR